MTRSRVCLYDNDGDDDDASLVLPESFKKNWQGVWTDDNDENDKYLV